VPLRGHFHPPLGRERHWESFHAAWTTALADALNRIPPEVELYAAAYRPIRRPGKDEVDLWPQPLALATPLPTIPLGLNAELALPLDLESAYEDVAQRRRLGCVLQSTRGAGEFPSRKGNSQARMQR
jgi:hypothetical protein